MFIGVQYRAHHLLVHMHLCMGSVTVCLASKILPGPVLEPLLGALLSALLVANKAFCLGDQLLVLMLRCCRTESTQWQRSLVV